MSFARRSLQLSNYYLFPNLNSLTSATVIKTFSPKPAKSRLVITFYMVIIVSSSFALFVTESDCVQHLNKYLISMPFVFISCLYRFVISLPTEDLHDD